MIDTWRLYIDKEKYLMKIIYEINKNIICAYWLQVHNQYT